MKKQNDYARFNGSYNPAANADAIAGNINAIDTVWVAICAALIFQMEGGLAFLEAGFIRSKNTMSIIAKVMIDIMFGDD